MNEDQFAKDLQEIKDILSNTNNFLLLNSFGSSFKFENTTTSHLLRNVGSQDMLLHFIEGIERRNLSGYLAKLKSNLEHQKLAHQKMQSEIESKKKIEAEEEMKRRATLPERSVLEQKTLKELKSILSDQSFSTAGNKADLIERIFDKCKF